MLKIVYLSSMKIEKVDLPIEVTKEVELKPILMERLGKVVLVAGKNGAGKSRLLNLIRTYAISCHSADMINDLKQGILRNEKSIARLKENLVNFERRLVSGVADNGITDLNRKMAISDIETDKKGIENNIKEIKLSERIVFSPLKDHNSLIEFVPKSLNLVDSYDITAKDIDSHAKLIYHIGTTNIANGVIPAIEKIQRSWVNTNTSTTNDLIISEDGKQKIDADYERLQAYIKLFLGVDLMRTSDGYPSLFGKRIGEANLSDGQKILLQFCMALYAQEAKLENVIIFMDEPENHLHPAALIEVLDKILPHLTNGQVWIATHSINVLAHFDSSNIWYIEEGLVSYAGNVPRKVLEGLLGKEEEIEKLSNFLALPAQMASTKFAFESLFYPQVLTTGLKDPQTNQIHEIIKTKVASETKLKVLDFGIGKGRLLSSIYENERLSGDDISEWLDFYGYDKFGTHKTLCEKVFASVYGAATDRYFNDLNQLLLKGKEGTFDVIIMCNVFHEIDPSEWINLFTSATSPFNLLKEDGYLLIIEDQFLAIGENAHSKGFLVFNELEFNTLFKIDSADDYVSTDYHQDGRLKSHHIPKKCLSRIDGSSKKKSIEILIQNSKDAIKDLRKLSPSYKNGRLHSFWAMQLANASLAFEEL